MAVIAFVALVVIAHDPFSRAPIEEPILIGVPTTADRSRGTPDYQFDDRAVREDTLAAKEKFGPHVGE
jgi:hypothetical protein